MPVGQRLVRALSPHQRPWHLLGAAAATFGPAAVFELAAPCRLQRGPTGTRRIHVAAPCRRPDTKSGEEAPVPEQHSRASASIFEELFPGEGEARPQLAGTLASQEDGAVGSRKRQDYAASAPAREEVLEEIRQWLQSELEAGEAPGQDKDSRSSAYIPRQTPKGDWGESASTSARRAPAMTGESSVSRAIPRDATQPTVLVLSGTTPSLLPSDFFRIAPRITDNSSDSSGNPNSRPVDGWSASNGGIYKIVQDRDPITLAPRGRYFLYFGSPAAALAYAQEMRELHKLARRAVVPAETGKSNSRRSIRRQNEDRSALGHAGTFSTSSSSISSSSSADATTAQANAADPFSNITGSITTGGSGLGINREGSAGGVNNSNRPGVVIKQKNRRTKNSYSNASLLAMGSEEHTEALRNFSLVVPTVRLHLSVQMPGDVQGMYTPSNTMKSKRRNVQVTLYDGEALDDLAATDTTTKVLVVFALTGNTASTGSSSNYIDVDGRGVTTVDGLRSLIDEDGARRNLPWGVSYGLNGVVPVRWLVDEQNRLMRKAQAAALQSQEEQAAGEKKEEPTGPEHEQEQKQVQEQHEHEHEQKHEPEYKQEHEHKTHHKKTPPALPTALWASRVPDLASKTDRMNENARYSRFVVSFSDNAEARRFVRGWHRRTVNVRQEHGLSRGAAMAAMEAALERGDDDEPIMVPAIVEATVLW